MTKTFVAIFGWFFIAFGVLSLLISVPALPVVQALLHILIGSLAVWSGFRGDSRRFALNISILFLFFSALGFFGIQEIGNLLHFTLLLIWIYLITGLIGVWLVMSEK